MAVSGGREIRQATELKARVFQTVAKDLGEPKTRVPKVREIVPQGGAEQAPKATRLLLHIDRLTSAER